MIQNLKKRYNLLLFRILGRLNRYFTVKLLKYARKVYSPNIIDMYPSNYRSGTQTFTFEREIIDDNVKLKAPSKKNCSKKTGCGCAKNNREKLPRMSKKDLGKFLHTKLELVKPI